MRFSCSTQPILMADQKESRYHKLRSTTSVHIVGMAAGVSTVVVGCGAAAVGVAARDVAAGLGWGRDAIIAPN